MTDLSKNNHITRRSFAQNLGASALFLGLGGLSWAKPSPTAKHITILHTNDTHSHIDPFSADHPTYANKGGVVSRAVVIEQIRKENPNTLLFDAGDIFQGTPYFNFYGGELEFKLMSKLKYDAATIGNHDLDNGLEGLLAQLPHAKFDFICSNYDFKNTIFDGHSKPYKIFVVDGIRVGVFGLGIRLEGLVDKLNYKETQYLNPIEIAQEMERKLRFDHKCDLVVCLSHLGYKYRNPEILCDLILAKETSETDVIIGGHTHTFLERPTLVKNKNDREVIVNQVGCFGVNLGRIDFFFDKNIKTNGVNIEV